MGKRDTQLIFFIIFIFLGLIVTVQSRSILFTNTQQSLSAAKNIEKLKDQIEKEKNYEDWLKEQINNLEGKRKQSLNQPIDTSPNATAYEHLKKQLDYLELAAGFKDVKGPGIIINLNDAVIGKTTNVNDYITRDVSDYMIHDFYIYRLLNELKSAGAEAIAINGERIISTSGQVCMGPTIKINGNRYPVPYEISAIGNVERMKKSIEESNVYNSIKNNVRIEIKITNEVVIPKYNGEKNYLISGLEDFDGEN